MNITEMKVDTKGRITIPNSFLKANGLERGKCKVVVIPNGNDSEAIFRFIKDSRSDTRSGTWQTLAR
jgi:bifunctional DNA-binding transcriptional regulator/antitoxin component of YhaV-PrlF toxin-antitoxin module|tara:strand:+ start:68 stop:268 length:201 start_codon:yes stop_codon:yes gene_type:complete